MNSETEHAVFLSLEQLMSSIELAADAEIDVRHFGWLNWFHLILGQFEIGKSFDNIPAVW